jgi:hypothetical protein
MMRLTSHVTDSNKAKRRGVIKWAAALLAVAAVETPLVFFYYENN